MPQKNQLEKIKGHGLGAAALLSFFWSFLLILMFKFLYPLFSFTIGFGPFYGIICMMVLFAFFAPFIQNFFFQVSYFKMAFLWVLFTFIGIFRLDIGPYGHSQKDLLLHLLSWQLPAMVFSLIYTLLYSREKSLKMDMPYTNAS